MKILIFVAFAFTSCALGIEPQKPYDYEILYFIENLHEIEMVVNYQATNSDFIYGQSTTDSHVTVVGLSQKAAIHIRNLEPAFDHNDIDVDGYVDIGNEFPHNVNCDEDCDSIHRWIDVDGDGHKDITDERVWRPTKRITYSIEYQDEVYVGEITNSSSRSDIIWSGEYVFGRI